ncbi:helix-turn-helix domain-containing protein [Haloplanus rallus]|uniref:Helix-turn-helix domain-containing protein n=2 Tax=Haloplanus rallus TaxID=1816183 RepID=A0A6B9F578_9EURY|nr:helix-turn-helix domain-containing protein [Haloplanus rallus]
MPRALKIPAVRRGRARVPAASTFITIDPSPNETWLTKHTCYDPPSATPLRSMAVIVELRIPTHQFELGRRIPTRSGGPTELERVNGVEDGSAPVFSLSDLADGRLDGRDQFADAEGYRFELVDVSEDCSLRLVSWDPEVDPFFGLLAEHGGSIRRGTGTPEAWTFEAEFPSHDDFSTFRSGAEDLDTPVEIERVYNPTAGTGAWYGLTPRQRRTLELAVERGYYDIPRRCTTLELADDLGISDQAVTERLRRGIVTFVTNALLPEDE